MKKLLVLALVLSMATMASASLSIVGAPAGPINIGDTVTLSLVSDSAISAGVGELPGWGLVAPTANASIAGGVSMVPSEPGITIYDGVLAGAGFTPPVGTEGVSGTLTVFAPVAAGTIFDTITLTAVAAGTFDLSLVAVDDTYTILTTLGTQSITINPIPEPMTMCLLGLGGLFLRRRSK